MLLLLQASVFVLLSVSIRDVSGLCSVPADQQSQVTALLHQMISSVGTSSLPDPSVLLAMNLAGKLNADAEKLLVKQLKEDAVKRILKKQNFSSGKVALYVLALRSSCENPFKVCALDKTVDLVLELELKMKEEIAHIEKYQSPLTTYYQVALGVLALCEERSKAAYPAAEILAKAAVGSQLEPSFFVDTASVAVMALTCIFNGKSVADAGTVEDGKMRSSVKEALAVLTSGILKAQKSDGLIGNIYSTGLAAQALTAVSDIYPVSDWNCPNTMAKLLAEIPQGAFSLPAAASQVLPFLNGKTYLDVTGVCAPEEVNHITVVYTVVNGHTGEDFKYSISVVVQEGSVLLDVMKMAEKLNPMSSEETTWGPFVTSIHGLYGSTNEKTYWQFLSGNVPLEQGVGSYKPKNHEHIQAVFKNY